MKYNIKWWLPLLIGFIAVSLDLASTSYALSVGGFYEANPYGNLPVLEYSVCLGFTLTFVWISKVSEGALPRRLSHVMSYVIALLPLTAFLNNALETTGAK